MPEVLWDLCNVLQVETNEDEESMDKLNEVIFHCGNFHVEDETNTFYTDGLSYTIETVVSRYLESVHRREMTFERLAHLEKVQDASYRPRYDITYKVESSSVWPVKLIAFYPVQKRIPQRIRLRTVSSLLKQPMKGFFIRIRLWYRSEQQNLLPQRWMTPLNRRNKKRIT